MVTETTGLLWRWSAAGPPAAYEVKQGEQTIYAAAVVIHPEEADLRPLTADVLEQRLAGQRDVRFHAWSPSSGERQDTFWTWLLVACAGCIFGELAALRWFRS